MSDKNYIKIRSILSSHVDDMLEFLVSKKNEAKNESVDIFSMFDTDSSSDINWTKNVENKSKLEVLKEEKNALGVYMSGNPLEDFIKIQSLLRTITGMEENLYIAVINKVKKVFTRANAMMFALQMTTIDGDIEGVIFSKKAIQFSSILEDNKLYWIVGRVDDKSAKKEEEVAKHVTASLSAGSNVTNIANSNNESGENNESSDSAESNDNFEEGAVSQIIEYVEKPKLLISHMVKIEDGFLELLKTSEQPPNEDFIKSFPEINWKEFEKEPSIFNKYIKEIENLNGVYTFKEKKRRTFNPNSKYVPNEKYLKKDDSAEASETAKLPTKMKVTLYKSLGEKISEIKDALKKEYTEGCIPIELWVEVSGGDIKKVKGDHWLPKELINK